MLFAKTEDFGYSLLLFLLKIFLLLYNRLLVTSRRNVSRLYVLLNITGILRADAFSILRGFVSINNIFIILFSILRIRKHLVAI